MDTLSHEQIEDRLPSLEGWSYHNDALHRTFGFDSFLDAIAFINRIAAKAEDRDHHPEIRNVYTTVEVSLSTHSAGGVTDKDFDLAAAIDEATSLGS